MRPLNTLLLSLVLVFILGQTSIFAQKSDHKRYVATIKTNRTKITAVIYQVTDSSLLIIPEKVLKTLQKSNEGFLSHRDIVPNLNEVLVKNIQQIHIRRSGKKGIKIASLIVGSFAGATLGAVIGASSVQAEKGDYIGQLEKGFFGMGGAIIGMSAGTLVGYLATTISLDSFYLEGSAKEFEKEKKSISRYSYKEQFAL
jgi:hypothetical protein